MRIACLGDSLTEGDYGVYNTRCIANVHGENYPYFLAMSLNGYIDLDKIKPEELGAHTSEMETDEDKAKMPMWEKLICAGEKYEVLNYGRCGYDATAFYNIYENGEVDVSGCDVIVIMLGTNGGMSGSEETPGNAA